MLQKIINYLKLELMVERAHGIKSTSKLLLRSNFVYKKVFKNNIKKIYNKSLFFN